MAVLGETKHVVKDNFEEGENLADSLDEQH